MRFLSILRVTLLRNTLSYHLLILSFLIFINELTHHFIEGMASSSPAVGVSAAAAGSTEFENTGLPDPELIRFSSLLEERGGEVVGSEWRHQQYYTKKDSIASLISEMPGPKRPLNCSSRFVLVQNSGGISSSF